MSCAEGIVGTFVHLGETADATIGADGGELIASSGKDFMTISLVTHIPYQFIVGGVEDVVKGYSKFDSTQTRGEMPRMGCQRVNNITAQLVGYLFEVGHGQFP